MKFAWDEHKTFAIYNSDRNNSLFAQTDTPSRGVMGLFLLTKCVLHEGPETSFFCVTSIKRHFLFLVLFGLNGAELCPRVSFIACS